MPDVVAFEFDPYLRVGDLAVRWETVGIAGAVLVALLAAGLLAVRLTPRDAERLRLDDLLFLTLGAVPGAVIGARIGYAIVHLDYYADRPADLLDPALGGLQLTLGVLGGIVTGALVARLLGLPLGRWAHVAAVPILVAIEGGKLALAWGGTGQGQPRTEFPATAYLGPGPWGSLAPALPSIPSQLVEGVATGAVALVCLALLAGGRFPRRDGRLLLVAAALWLPARFAVAATWRDPLVAGDVLGADQVLSLGLLALDLVALAVVVRAAGRAPDRADAKRTAAASAPDWPAEEVTTTWRGGGSAPR